jgi:hypothetical protein
MPLSSIVDTARTHQWRARYRMFSSWLVEWPSHAPGKALLLVVVAALV